MDLNDRLDEVINQSTSKFNIIKDNVSLIFYIRILQINLIGKQIEEENERAANFLDKKNNYIKILEQKIDERFNQEAQIREEVGSKLLNIIEDRFSSLKNEISKESANRFECIENLKSYLENDVPKLNEMLNNEKTKREEGDDGIDKKVTEEIMQVQGTITEDKKLREVAKVAFDSVDTDRSGLIDQEELEKVMAQISQDMGAEPPSKEDVKEVLEHLDTDHSGKIDFEEFSQLIKDVLSAMIEEDN